eukprot:1439720-Rhodomonas_salina.3
MPGHSSHRRASLSFPRLRSDPIPTPAPEDHLDLTLAISTVRRTGGDCDGDLSRACGQTLAVGGQRGWTGGAIVGHRDCVFRRRVDASCCPAAGCRIGWQERVASDVRRLTSGQAGSGSYPVL